jgi:hypothetical protein
VATVTRRRIVARWDDKAALMSSRPCMAGGSWAAQAVGVDQWKIQGQRQRVWMAQEVVVNGEADKDMGPSGWGRELVGQLPR